MNKNIWFINQYAGDSTSGWGERNFYLAEEFVRQGYDVTIFSATYNHLFRNVKSFAGSYDITYDNGVRFYWIKTVNYGESRTIMRVYSWFEFVFKLHFLPKKEIPRPDYIIVSSISLFPVLNARYFKRKYKARKFILEIRDLWPLTLMMIGGVSKRHPLVILLSRLERYAYRNADEIVSVLKNADRHIRTVIKKSFKFHWIPNGIKKELLMQAQPDRIEEQLAKIPSDKFVVMYAGTLGYINAMEYVVKAAVELSDNSDIYFVIIGEGDQLPLLRGMAAGKSNIAFLPKVAKDDLQLILQQASAFVISWRRRDFYEFGVSANKYSDYMLAEKPIVSANSIEDDPVRLAGCGIVTEAEDTEQLVEAISRLAAMSAEQRASLASQGKSYLEGQLLYSQLAGKYIQLFD